MDPEVGLLSQTDPKCSLQRMCVTLWRRLALRWADYHNSGLDNIALFRDSYHSNLSFPFFTSNFFLAEEELEYFGFCTVRRFKVELCCCCWRCVSFSILHSVVTNVCLMMALNAIHLTKESLVGFCCCWRFPHLWLSPMWVQESWPYNGPMNQSLSKRVAICVHGIWRDFTNDFWWRASCSAANVATYRYGLFNLSAGAPDMLIYLHISHFWNYSPVDWF